MGKTLIEKILGAHAGREVAPGEIVDVQIDLRAARDFGGANVVKNLRQHGLGVADPRKTIFTFDCNPTGSDQKYAANQQFCRQFARQQGLTVFDIDRGIGTHVAVDEGRIGPGGTLVSTDSHANILGAIGAFGQGMGDVDIAQAFARGNVWFEVPPTLRIVLKGTPSPDATAKDLALALVRHFGAGGLLGYAAELTGPAADAIDLAGQFTIASMATEMGGIILFIAPSPAVIAHCKAAGTTFEPVTADADARYERTVEIDIEGLPPLISRPGHPEDVVEVSQVAGRRVDSVFIGSCTNGRFEDLAAAAAVLKGRHVAPGVVLKIVPATDAIWRRAMTEGLFEIFKSAGALVSNAGCAGCAAGQVGQNGPGEVTVSTGNRNFVGKQGEGEDYLASPATAAATAVAGAIATARSVLTLGATAGLSSSVLPATLDKPNTVSTNTAGQASGGTRTKPSTHPTPPTHVTGRVWVIRRDNIDTDMIFHNRHLAITDIAEMGKHAFGNLAGWQDFAAQVRPGDIVVTGENFGCGSCANRRWIASRVSASPCWSPARSGRSTSGTPSTMPCRS